MYWSRWYRPLLLLYHTISSSIPVLQTQAAPTENSPTPPRHAIKEGAQRAFAGKSSALPTIPRIHSGAHAKPIPRTLVRLFFVLPHKKTLFTAPFPQCSLCPHLSWLESPAQHHQKNHLLLSHQQQPQHLSACRPPFPPCYRGFPSGKHQS